MQKAIHVVGARPNYMKVAPLMREMQKRPAVWEQMLVHTGQHYDHQMSQTFFEDLGLPQPDIYLGIGSGTHSQHYARVLAAFEAVLNEHRPDWLIVVGDVNSTVACALCAAQLGVRVAHVEAGLRSFDRTMPEEINRVVTDHLANVLFTTEESGNENLLKEGISPEQIKFVGNTMIDSLVSMLPCTENGAILDRLDLWQLRDGNTERSPRPYILATLHRPANVDDPRILGELMAAFQDIGERVPIVFPVHPRTRQRINDQPFSFDGGGVRLLEPLGYRDFLTLLRHSALVLTDSGGIQEEATYLGVPCLTMRPNTERPVTITLGTNQLIQQSRSAVTEAVSRALNGSRRPGGIQRPPLWDGRASERIVSELEAL